MRSHCGLVVVPSFGGLTTLLFATLTQGSSWTDPCDSVSQASVGTGIIDPNHAVWGRVLSAHVVAAKNVLNASKGPVSTSLVDYEALRANPSVLREYLQQLCHVDLDALTPRDAVALLANAYNALMLVVVIRFSPSKSVLEIDGVWAKKVGTVGGLSVSLDDIEHDLIRGERPAPDPKGPLSARAGVQGRVHAALTCASLSCPALLSEPFVGTKLDEQLTAATRQWLANPTKNRMSQDGRSVTLSKIFDWYARDFIAAAGSVPKFVAPYAPSSWPTSDYPIDFMTYNWGLNLLNCSDSCTYFSGSSAGLSASMHLVSLLFAILVAL